MSIAVVTSCSAAGLQQYGHRFLDTFNEFWPQEVDLFLISEDSMPVVLRRGTLHLFQLSDSMGWLEFCQCYRDDPRVARMQARAVKQFRFDAWKFCKKVFAIQMAARFTQRSRLLWLDADVFTYATVPPTLFDTLPSNDLAVAYLDRGAYHSECGFIGYNLKHPMTHRFIDEVARMYSSGDVFTLDQWQDCFVFDYVRRGMSLPAHKIPHKSNAHPFVHSELGKYMDHLKGNRKKAGVSPEHPYRKPPSMRRK